MREGKSCFFIGHHDVGENIYPLLKEAVERHITQYGVTDFFVGYHGHFDAMAAQAVCEAKKQHCGIRLQMVLVYHPAFCAIEIPDGFDGTFYPFEDERVPKRLAIIKANEKMVRICDCLIAFAWHFFGGAGRIVEYARRREKKGLICVENLGRADRSDAP